MKLTAPAKAATTGRMAKTIRLSPLAMQNATEMNAGKSLDQIRALNPGLTDENGSFLAGKLKDDHGRRSDSLQWQTRP